MKGFQYQNLILTMIVASITFIQRTRACGMDSSLKVSMTAVNISGTNESSILTRIEGGNYSPSYLSTSISHPSCSHEFTNDTPHEFYSFGSCSTAFNATVSSGSLEFTIYRYYTGKTQKISARCADKFHLYVDGKKQSDVWNRTVYISKNQTSHWNVSNYFMCAAPERKGIISIRVGKSPDEDRVIGYIDGGKITSNNCLTAQDCDSSSKAIGLIINDTQFCTGRNDSSSQSCNFNEFSVTVAEGHLVTTYRRDSGGTTLEVMAYCDSSSHVLKVGNQWISIGNNWTETIEKNSQEVWARNITCCPKKIVDPPISWTPDTRSTTPLTTTAQIPDISSTTTGSTIVETTTEVNMDAFVPSVKGEINVTAIVVPLIVVILILLVIVIIILVLRRGRTKCRQRSHNDDRSVKVTTKSSNRPHQSLYYHVKQEDPIEEPCQSEGNSSRPAHYSLERYNEVHPLDGMPSKAPERTLSAAELEEMYAKVDKSNRQSANDGQLMNNMDTEHTLTEIPQLELIENNLYESNDYERGNY